MERARRSEAYRSLLNPGAAFEEDGPGESLFIVPTPAKRTCTYPVGKRGFTWEFCGEPIGKPGSSYCEHHHKACHITSDEKGQR